MRYKTLLLLMVILFVVMSIPHDVKAQSTEQPVVLAYVHENIVQLADGQGNPLMTTGPEFQSGQSARLFWTPDGRVLYIARRDGLFETTARGGAAVRLPGDYGLTVTLDLTGEVFYYLESTNPQPAEDENYVVIPLRELNILNMSGGAGRLVGYVGPYPVGTANVTLNAAALQYARDGGLLGPSRPQLFSTYGETLFVSCCFPEAGLGAINIQTGDAWRYVGAETLIVGAAAVNNTYSRLAGPTTDNNLLVVDLITGGTRVYTMSVGAIEHVAWSPDEREIYLAVRTAPQDPLLLSTLVTAQIDTRSALISVLSLDLVTGQVRQLTTLGEFYGVSSMAATEEYIFVVAVESNARLVEDLNAGRLPADISPTDPALMTTYLPSTILFRITPDGREAFSIMADVWGVVVRPQR